MSSIAKFRRKWEKAVHLRKELNRKIEKLRFASPCGTLKEQHINNFIDAIKSFYKFSQYVIRFLGGDDSSIRKIKPKIDGLKGVSKNELLFPDTINQFIRVLTDFTYVLDDSLEIFEQRYNEEIKQHFGESWKIYKDMNPYYGMLEVKKEGDILYASNINNITNYFVTLVEKFYLRALLLSNKINGIGF